MTNSDVIRSDTSTATDAVCALTELASFQMSVPRIVVQSSTISSMKSAVQLEKTLGSGVQQCVKAFSTFATVIPKIAKDIEEAGTDKSLLLSSPATLKAGE
jgi:hypothetical protein